ncbi:hypothetical protein THARTR1_02689 [Trichoderma harzianum]|uniref:CFEM domain-containing protein n=1 Tax=Trichoderma harzianum TaxID=5544 RepID=A0A2K0UIR2_TRIHA|nr:hypothetical protein THARTR1_02689 [Trichoderma harzianum]
MKALVHILVFFFAALAACTSSTTGNITALLDSLPKCSVNCIVDGVAQDGCTLTDLSCGCSKINELTKIVSPCLAKANCSLEDMTQAASTVVQFCESAGFLVNNTSNGPASTTTGAPPPATTTSGAGRFSDEIGMAYAAIGVLLTMMVL